MVPPKEKLDVCSVSGLLVRREASERIIISYFPLKGQIFGFSRIPACLRIAASPSHSPIHIQDEAQSDNRRLLYIQNLIQHSFFSPIMAYRLPFSSPRQSLIDATSALSIFTTLSGRFYFELRN